MTTKSKAIRQTVLSWRAANYVKFPFRAGWAAFVVFFTIPALNGYLLSQSLQAITDQKTSRAIWLAIGLAGAEIVRIGFLYWGAIWFTASWNHTRQILRANMLLAQMSNGGKDAGQPISSPSESIARFRDDTEDVANYVDNWLDVSGTVTFALIAFWVMARANGTATAVMVVPILLALVVMWQLAVRMEHHHRADRIATAKITGLLGEAMNGVVTVELAGASSSVVNRFASLLGARRDAAVKSRVMQDASRIATLSVSEIGLALAVIAAGPAVVSGEFGPAEMGLLIFYGGWLGYMPRMIGLMLNNHRKSKVAFEGMSQLVPDRDPEVTVANRDFDFRHDSIEPFVVNRPDAAPLQQLSVEDLVVDLGSGRRQSLNFTLKRGSFTIITGPIGSGKTTALRTLLGLVPPSTDRPGSGRVTWNGIEVGDRAAFFVPPRCGYLPQVPQLVSDSLADNIMLGVDNPDHLNSVIQAAALNHDLADMIDGLSTVVGPRGVRLSGGQRQRVATARAMATGADLLILDDLSSALDIETELELWANLAAAGTTVLAVSHRPAALAKADQIIELKTP